MKGCVVKTAQFFYCIIELFIKSFKDLEEGFPQGLFTYILEVIYFKRFYSATTNSIYST